MITSYKRIRHPASGKPETGNRRRKSLGQCFLEDRNILALEAKLADCTGKTVLEIGAGDGRLTESLLLQKPRKIIAVEKDPAFAAILREKFADAPVEVVEADILEIAPPEIDAIVGNIPYYISSDVVFQLKKYSFAHAILMVQKEFAEKMLARPKDRNYGRLSVTSQLSFEIQPVRVVLRHLFRPVPKVDSMIIRLTRKSFSPSTFQENVIRYIFQHRNKTVRNALLDSKMFEKTDLEVLGDFAKRRGITLSKEECLEVAGLLE
jgi:ribosomal RNA small subunit methyltransferase A